jgi:hypothetical protein
MIPRNLIRIVHERSLQLPIVTVTGPRESGVSEVPRKR